MQPGTGAVRVLAVVDAVGRYRGRIGAQEVDLPLVPIADDLVIALLITVDHGVRFAEQAGSELAALLAPYEAEVVVSVATMGIPLAIEVTRALGLDDYLILQKTPKIHLQDALSEPVTSITTGSPQKLLFDRARVSVVAGRRVQALRRRGKYLDWALEAEIHLLMHLRMTGTLLLDPPGTPAHTRVVISLSGGHRLLFVDPRRFGTGQLVIGDGALEDFYATRLGVEPFDDNFTPAHLRALARGRSAPIKAFLLDQRMIAGIGNIYADEALFRTGVHPRRAAGTLRPAQYELLRDAIREVLSAGIDARGASIDDFRHLDGARGSFQDRFLVHRRGGEPNKP